MVVTYGGARTLNLKIFLIKVLRASLGDISLGNGGDDK